MAKTRALMTETERERLAGLADVEDIKVYQAKSRVRRRITEEFDFDVQILAENHPDLFEELVEVVEAEKQRYRSSADSEPPDRREEPAEPDTTHDTRAETAETSDPRTDELRDRMEEELANHHVPGRADSVEEKRREALRWAWDYLRAQDEPLQSREWGGAVQSEFGDDPDFKYAGESRWEGYQFWDNCGNEVLPDLPGVVKGGDGWRIDEVE